MTLLRLLMVLILVIGSGSAFADPGEVRVIDLKHRRAEELLPVVKQLMGDQGTAAAFDNSLILRGPNKDLAAAEKLLKQLDVERVMLRVEVRQEAAAGGVQSSMEAAGRFDRSSRILSNDPSAMVQGKHSRNLGNMNQSVEQYVQILDGEQAFIEVGRQVPFVRFRSYVTGLHQGFSEEIGLRDVTTGFMVRPTFLGNTVELELIPRLASENAEREGVVDLSSMTTRVNVPLGEWVDLGGNISRQNDAGAAILSLSAGEQGAVRRMWVKVTKWGE